MQPPNPPNPPQDDPQQQPQGAAPCPACLAAKQAGASWCPGCGRCLAEPALEEARPTMPTPQPGEPGEPPQPLAKPPEATPPPPTAPADPAPLRPADTAPPAPAVPADQTPPPGTQGPPEQAQPEASSSQMCVCGVALSPDAKFCSSCGTEVPQASAAATPPYVLRCETRSGQCYSVPLNGTECLIGKLPECDLAVPEDGYLSRRHARLTWKDGQWVLEDLGSANGTYVKVSAPVPLEPGAEILVGTTLVCLEKENQVS